MPIWLFPLAAVLIGGLVALQPLINAILARATGSAFGATTISVFVALMGAVALMLVTGRGDTSRAALATVPWWVYLAGFIGTIFVCGGMVIAPVIGASLFFVCIVAGQLTGATLADHFGAFGLDVRTVSPQRLIGLALVLGGAVLVQRG